MKTICHRGAALFIALILSCCPADAGIIVPARLQVPAQANARAEYGGRKIEKGMAAARKLLFEKGIDECRKAIESIRETNADIRHADVLTCEWLLDANQYANAATVMESLAVKHPDRPDVRLLFAQVGLHQNRLFDAWVHASAAETSATPQAWSDDFRADFRQEILKTQATIATRRNEWETARKLYRQLMDKDASPETMMALGRAEYFSGNEHEAETLIRQACKSEGITAIPEIVLAGFNEQQPEKSEAWLRKGLARKSVDGIRVRLEYARWLISRNRGEDAVEIVANVKPPQQLQTEFQYATALAQRMAGKVDLAADTLVPLHQADPANFNISNQLALVLVESSDEGKRGRALQIAEANVRRFPQGSEALSTLGWIQFRLGDVATAERTLTAATGSGQVSRDTAYFLATVKKSLQKTTEAKQLIQASRDSNGPFFNAHVAASF